MEEKVLTIVAIVMDILGLQVRVVVLTIVVPYGLLKNQVMSIVVDLGSKK